ncbi:hypothetical protein [Nocardia sp. X0981]
MNALLTGDQVAVAAMTTGRRYGGEEAPAAGIVDDIVAADALRGAAVARATEPAADRTPGLPGITRSPHVAAPTGPAVADTPDDLAFAGNQCSGSGGWRPPPRRPPRR